VLLPGGGRQQLIEARKGEKVDRYQKANDVPELVKPTKYFILKENITYWPCGSSLKRIHSVWIIIHCR